MKKCEMELMEHLRKQNKDDLDAYWKIVKRMIDILRVLHKNGIYHNDAHHENWMICDG